MVLYFLNNFFSDIHGLAIFNYLTVRSVCAILTSLSICLIVGPRFIKFMENKQKKGQPIRIDGPPSHLLSKKGTPTMGGILILLSLIVSTLIWSDLENNFIWIVLYSTLSFGILGFIDDMKKILNSSSDGVLWKIKLIFQILISLSVIYLIINSVPEFINYSISLPFLKSPWAVYNWVFVLFSLCVLVGTSNAVNLTDGLDGLAIIPVMITASSMGLIAYLAGNYIFSHYLYIQFIPGAGELTVICAALFGSGLGFLWFNAPPAMIFMGDTGSLSLGALLASVAISVKHEIVLFIIGGIFVLEAASVIIQVSSYKLTGRRVFMMAPLHHHYEQKGWSEATVVIRFWIVSLILAIIGLATLKVR
jgi:phospho-N-acetylmuramoyl-pentapeptide-transferase